MAHYTIWLAEQQARGVPPPPIIDAELMSKRRKSPREWTVKESLQVLFALVFLGFAVPFVVLFGGLILLVIWDHITGVAG